MDEDNLLDPLDVVSVRDPAIDWSKSKVRGEDGYEGTRKMSMLVPLPGRTFVIWQLRALTTKDMQVIDQGAPGRDRLIRAVMFGLMSVRNVGGMGVLRPSHSIPDGRGGDRLIWHDDQIEDLRRRWGLRILDEIGYVAYQRAYPGNEWSGSELYKLPDSVLDELERIERRHAASLKQCKDGTASSDE